MMDPNDLGQGLGAGGDPAAGSPTPEFEQLRKRNDELEADNAKLRAERRASRVVALADQHGLSARQAIELAGLSSLDEIEARALEFVQANAAGQPPQPQAQPPAPTTPPAAQPNATALAGMEGGEDGGQPSAPPKTPNERMLEEIQGAKSLREIEQIQQRYQAELRANQ